MAVIPEGVIGTNLVNASEPSLTWYIDQTTQRIRGECDGYDAVRQAVDIILHTQRFEWQIYKSSSGVDYRDLIGLDMGYVSIELQRRVKEALRMDSRVIDATNFTFSSEDGVLNVFFTVNTVYGPVEETMEVTIS